MPRDGYKQITIRAETYDLLDGDKAEGATWDEYARELHEAMAWALEEQAEYRQDREFSVRADAAEPNGGIVVAELTDAERERLVDAFESRIRELRGEAY